MFGLDKTLHESAPRLSTSDSLIHPCIQRQQSQQNQCVEFASQTITWARNSGDSRTKEKSKIVDY